jgi:hypothetical protein
MHHIIKMIPKIMVVGILLLNSALLAESGPPIIAVAPFKTGIDFAGWEAVLLVRNQVAAKLWSDYDCILLNRAHGYSVSLEDSLKRLSAMGSADYQPEVIFTADNIISGTFQPGLGKTYDCVIRMSDLIKGDPRHLRTITVKVPTIPGAAGPISEAIAKELGLKRKTIIQPSVFVTSRTPIGVVMPFMVVASDGMNAEEKMKLKTELRLRVELALQNDNKIKIVDHAAIDKIVKEHAMAKLMDVPHFGRISQLVGADYMLLGSIHVSADKFTIELMAVDSRCSEILSAAIQSVPKDKLSDVIERLSLDVFATLAPPHPLVPSTVEQRRREADFYLYMLDVEEGALSSSGMMCMAEYAEMAYLVGRGNEAVMRDIVIAAGDFCISRVKREKPFKQGLNAFAEKLLEAYPKFMADSEIILSRATAYAGEENFDKARPLIEKYYAQEPASKEERARWVMGETLLAQGKASEALRYLNEEDDYMTHIQCLAVRIYNTLKDHDRELVSLSRLSYKRLLNEGLYERYLELLAKKKGDQAVAELLETTIKRDSWFAEKVFVRLLVAEYGLKAGNKDRAARICQQLLDEGKSHQWRWDYVEDNVSFKRRLEVLQSQAGQFKESWLKAREIQSWPTNCAIYLQPLGDVDQKLLTKIKTAVKDFYGAKTEILPAIPLSRDKDYYVASRNQFDASLVLADVTKKMKVPDDALVVGMIMRESMFADHLRWSYARRDGRLVLVSYFMWAASKDASLCEIALRNSVVADIALTMNVRGGEYPCITSGSDNARSILRKKFAFSEPVQLKYKALDLAAEQQKNIEFFRKAGATIVSPSSIMGK